MSALTAFLGLTPASGQLAVVHAPDRPARGSETNVFASWAGGEAIEGVVVDVPQGWSVVSASILREGYRSVPAEIRPLEGRRYVVLAEAELRGPHEIVIRMQIGESLGPERIVMMPALRVNGRLISREAYRIEHAFRTTEAAPDPDNYVLSFADAQPLLLRRSRLPDLNLKSAFSLSLWFKTVGLGEVILSTWNGDDNTPYPLELIVDAAGKLRCYRGRPGEHLSLSSRAPVADGSWHRLVITNEPEEGRMRMSVDGKTADSLYSTAPHPFATNLPVALGGRVAGKNTYFDDLRRFSGMMDNVRFSAPDTREITFDFEGRIPADLLHEPVRKLSRERSDLVIRRPVESLRADVGEGGVTLSWRAGDPRVKEFLVERSPDGRVFEVVARLGAGEARDGLYRSSDALSGVGVAYYRVRQIYQGGGERLSGTIKVGLGPEQPESVLLIGNFPNPFNSTTTITYELHENELVRLSVWDLAGQQVDRLVERVQAPGTYQVQFAAEDLPSGTYFVRLETRNGIKSHKMILSK